MQYRKTSKGHRDVACRVGKSKLSVTESPEEDAKEEREESIFKKQQQGTFQN